MSKKKSGKTFNKTESQSNQYIQNTLSKKQKVKFPKIGHRILKSSISVFICFIIYLLRGRTGIHFYSMIAALWCIRPYMGNMKEMAIQRTFGTLFGALFGLIVLLLKIHLFSDMSFEKELLFYVIISVCIIPIIYSTILLKHTDASYFSCVVFLSIAVVHAKDDNPYLFVLNRITDTMIGIVVGIIVNSFSIPSKKRKDILFVSGIDDALISKKEELSPYSKRQINNMIEDGANFTISTMRTPASLMNVLNGVNLSLPIIAMDGAVLYDIQKNEFMYIFVISHNTSTELLELMKSENIHAFSNVIADDCLLIFYDGLFNDVQKEMFEKLHRSPYRNYINMPVVKNSKIVYFFLVEKTEVLERFYIILSEKGYTEKLKILFYPYEEYPGYSCIKIFNKNATRDNMLLYLEKTTGLSKTITFGSIPGKYDILINEDDTNQVARTLRKMYKVPFWKSV